MERKFDRHDMSLASPQEVARAKPKIDEWIVEGLAAMQFMIDYCQKGGDDPTVLEFVESARQFGEWLVDHPSIH